MAISDKLNYLIETKQLFKDRLNSLGAEIIESTTFRNYLTWLDTFYNQASDKTYLAKNGVVGRTSQESTKGKNAYNINVNYDWVGANTNYTITGNTINVNGKYFVAGLHSVKSNTNYTISAIRQIIQDNSTCGTIRAFTLDKSQMLGEGKTTFTFNTGNNSQIYVLLYAGLNQQGNIDFSNIQLEEGNSATNWEEYTGGEPSPSPDYPQEISNLSGDVEYKVRGKNLLDTSSMIVADLNNDTGEEVAQTGTKHYRSGYIKVSPNTQYTFTTDYIYPGTGITKLMEYAYNKTFIRRNRQSSTNQVITFTTSATTEYIRVVMYSNNSFTDFYSLKNMVVKGNDTAYEAYKEKSYTINLGDIELCKIGDYKDRIYPLNGKWYLEKKIGKVVLDGSESSWGKSGASTDTLFVASLGLNYVDIYSKEATGSLWLTNRFSVGTGLGQENKFYTYNPDTTWGYRNIGFTVNQSIASDINAFKSWLSSNLLILYYVLATPTTTEITEETHPTLYSQLLAIQEFLTKYKINNEFLLDYSSPEIEY